ncbi:MAG TPA: N-acetylmuramoyl-L-alanine amidase [Gammaproteobacteria bacterium]
MKQGVSWLALVGALAIAWGVAEAATVQNIRLWSGPESTRVVLDLSGPVEHRVFELTDPDRVVIDLPRSSMARTPPFEPKGYVANLRTGSRPNGELRVVLDLKQAVRPRSFLLPPSDGYGHRLVIDLLPPADPASVTRAAPARAEASVRDLVIAIDAGHGGEDPGAIGRGGAREKDVVLAIARKLADEIRAQPGMRPVMIRDGDYLVSHRRRMQIAREAGADFFISIHADSYRDASAKGVTVYALSEKGATDEAALLVAHRENAELRGGVSLADKDQVLARVLVDLSQGAALSASAAAAERLLRRLGAVTTLRKTQVQRAPFLVLKSPDIPSLLIETGYISNPREEALLRDPDHQAKLARAMRAGIVDYFRANPVPGTYFADREEPAVPVAARTADMRAGEPIRHVIARGETLSGIAERYRVTTTSLKRSNRLRSDVIRVGQVLTIPQGG